MWLISQVLQNKKKQTFFCQMHDLSLWWTKILSQTHTHTHSLTQAQTLSHTYSLHISYPNSCKGPHIHDNPLLAHPMQWLRNIGFSGGGGVWGTLKNMNWNYTVPGRQSSETWTEITLYQADNPQKHELSYFVPGRQSSETWPRITLYQADNHCILLSSRPTSRHTWTFRGRCTVYTTATIHDPWESCANAQQYWYV